MPPTPRPPRGGAAFGGAAPPFAARFDVFLQDAALVAGALHLAEIDAELARELAHAGTCVGEREGRLVDCAAGVQPAQRGVARAGAAAGCSPLRGCADGCGRCGAIAAALPVDQRQHHACLRDTLSPTLTLIRCTMPPSGAGTSIVALSDSSVTSAILGLHRIARLHQTSITGTSLKSPMSGTRTSATPAGALVGAGGADTAVFGAAARRRGRRAPESSMRITLPSLTLSPTLTLTSLTSPRDRRRHVHRRLVRLERDERVLRLHGVARLDHDLDDRHVLEVADVRNFDFDHAHDLPIASPRLVAGETCVVMRACHTVQGSGRSVSRPYFLIACSTTSGLISPSSASAFSAATAT